MTPTLSKKVNGNKVREQDYFFFTFFFFSTTLDSESAVNIIVTGKTIIGKRHVGKNIY